MLFMARKASASKQMLLIEYSSAFVLEDACLADVTQRALHFVAETSRSLEKEDISCMASQSWYALIKEFQGMS